MAEFNREEAALKVLCALVSNESIVSSPKISEAAKASIVGHALGFVDALEAGGYELELVETEEDDDEAGDGEEGDHAGDEENAEQAEVSAEPAEPADDETGTDAL